MIFVLISLASSTVIGIDFGYNTVKVSLASRTSPLHLASNLNFKRQSENKFSFWNRTRSSNYTSVHTWNESTMNDFEWAFGNEAHERCLRFPKLCLRGNIFNNDTYFKLRGYEIMAMSLKQLINSISKAERINDTIQAVVSLPPQTRAHEKSFAMIALSMAGINVTQFVDTTNAPAILYALEKTSQFRNTSKTIAFVDVGAKGTRVSIFNFSATDEPIQIKQLSSVIDETIGGKDIDEDLAQLIAPLYDINMNDLKDRVNFVDDISKVKEMLSIHRSVDLKFEGEEDLEPKLIQVTREQLNSVGGRLNATLKALIHKAVLNANTTIDKVEILGGSSRIKFVQETIQEAFNVSKLGKSMDAEGASALGSGYIAANNSPEFVVRKHNASFLLVSPAVLHTNNKIYKIFNRGDSDDSSPVVQLTALPDQIYTISTDDYMKPYQRFTLPKIKKPTNIEISFVHNFFMMPIPYNVVNSKDGNEIDMRFENIGWELSQEEINHSMNKVNTFIDLQQKRRNKEITINEYETLLLKLRKFLTYAEGITKEEKNLVEKIVTEHLDWFESLIGDKISHEEFKQRISEVHNATDEIFERGSEKYQYPITLKKIQKTLQKISDFIEKFQEKDVPEYIECVKALNKTRSFINNRSIKKVVDLENARNELKKAMIDLKNYNRPKKHDDSSQDESINDDGPFLALGGGSPSKEL